MTVWFYIELLIALLIGLGCGSYATMPYYRLPKKIPCAGKWIGKKSACPNCNTQLRTRDLIPVFNWLLTKGQCAFCIAKVNPVYFFIEFSCAVFSVLTFLKYGIDQYYIIIFSLFICLIIITAIDYSYKIIPDQVLVVMLMFGLVYRVLQDQQIYEMIQTFTIAILFSISFTKIYEHYKKQKFDNYGYLKIFSIAGIWFSYKQLFIYIITSAIISVILHMIYNNIGEEKRYKIIFTLAVTLPFLQLLI